MIARASRIKADAGEFTNGYEPLIGLFDDAHVQMSFPENALSQMAAGVERRGAASPRRERSLMIEAMKPAPEMIEGPEAFERFRNAVKAMLSVPHSVIQKRVEQHRREAAKNPNRPGPKPKSKK